MKFVLLLAALALMYNIARLRARLLGIRDAQNSARVLRATICVWSFWLLFLGVCVARPGLLILAPIIVATSGGIRFWRKTHLPTGRAPETVDLERMKRVN